MGGILSSLTSEQTDSLAAQSSAPDEEVPQSLPSRFIACVRSVKSSERIIAALPVDQTAVKIVRKDNIAAAQLAHIVILACKPYMVKDVLGEPGMAEALRGKLLISICAGITSAHIASALYGSESPDKTDHGRCTIVRAMCNTAGLIRESMTVIGITDPPLPPESRTLVTWIFRRIGDVVYLPEHLMDASTALCGSGPAMFALMLEAAIDGAVAMGLPRAEAQRMAAQTMRGTTGLVQSGEHPAILREKVCTPGGCTIGGLLVLEEGRVRGTVSRAMREATVVASELGKGVQNVNGTRFPTVGRQE